MDNDQNDRMSPSAYINTFIRRLVVDNQTSSKNARTHV